MEEYIDKNKLIRDLIDNRSFYPAIVKNAIESAPIEDVVPRSKVEKIFEEFRNAMRSEITRNEELFKEDEDDFYEGRNDAFRTSINFLAELKKKYIGE